MTNALSDKELLLIDAYWRAANYLSVGQIYLYDNPLLKTPLTKEHVKPRLLGHWGTTPGLNFVYAHLSRCISRRELDAIFITGPGHGGPGLLASTTNRSNWWLVSSQALPSRRAWRAPRSISSRPKDSNSPGPASGSARRSSALTRASSSRGSKGLGR